MSRVHVSRGRVHAVLSMVIVYKLLGRVKRGILSSQREGLKKKIRGIFP